MSDKLGRLRRPVRLDPLATQIFDIIKDAIFQRRLLPAQQFREMQLAKSFSVSQATVREALAQLEQTGLVVRSATRRITVTGFSREAARAHCGSARNAQGGEHPARDP